MNWRKAGMPVWRLLASSRGTTVMEEQSRGGGGCWQVVTPLCEEWREEGRAFDAWQ